MHSGLPASGFKISRAKREMNRVKRIGIPPQQVSFIVLKKPLFPIGGVQVTR
jgi:hypothetical protein